MVRSIGLIDANILLRSVVGDVPEQAGDVNRLLDRIASGDLTGVVPITIVQEFVFTLERFYETPRSDIAGAIRDMLAIAHLDVEHSAALLDCLDDYVSRRSISFPDAFHCALARQFHDGQIVSYDRALSRIPGITRIEP